MYYMKNVQYSQRYLPGTAEGNDVRLQAVGRCGATCTDYMWSHMYRHINEHHYLFINIIHIQSHIHTHKQQLTYD